MKTIEFSENILAKIQALLFVADKPLMQEDFFKLLDQEVPLSIIISTLQYYKTYLDSPSSGFFLYESASGFQLKTKKDFHGMLKKFYNKPKLNLTPQGLETLSIIAYKQPVKKVDIDSLRGVDSSYIIKFLVEKKMIESIKSTEFLSYQTTQEFLDFFQLQSLDDLPTEETLEEEIEENLGMYEKEFKTILGLEVQNLFTEKSLDTSSLDTLLEKEKTPFLKDLKNSKAADVLDRYLLIQEIIQSNHDSFIKNS
jgi:segregation and condensation protein B